LPKTQPKCSVWAISSIRVQAAEGNLTLPVLFSGSWDADDDVYNDYYNDPNQVIVAVPVSKAGNASEGSLVTDNFFATSRQEPANWTLTGTEGSVELKLLDEVDKRGNDSVAAQVLGVFPSQVAAWFV
jgi:hypothetical protein